jgi:hypothetical protein
MLSEWMCRPAGAVNIWNLIPRADARGYYVSPLRGYEKSRRLSLRLPPIGFALARRNRVLSFEVDSNGSQAGEYSAKV